MRGTIFLLFVILAFCSCQNVQTRQSLDPIVLKVKETSLYTDQVDWEVVNRQFIKLSKDTEDVKPGFQFLINSLGDKHATIRSTKDHSIVVSYTGERYDVDTRQSQFVNDVINDMSAQFSYKLLDDNVGYLKVVGIGPGNVKEQADQIRNGLKELNASYVDKWILDLRYNGGGNMEPMLSGLAPLLGDGFLGGAINAQGVIREYKIEDGEFYNWGRLACEMSNLPELSVKEKVAVLLSRYTVSSGEMVAVAFKGRANTLFIGEDSGGYTTGNGYDQINDDFVLVISQDVFIDRNKEAYVKRVGVDEYIEFQHNTTLENDVQVARAIEWLIE